MLLRRRGRGLDRRTFLRRLGERDRGRRGAGGSSLLPTANHDFSRLACGPRTAEQLGAAFAFLLTWAALPAIYYGDEIGMRYLPGLPDKEGSVCDPALQPRRARAPRCSGTTAPNAGFSTAPADRLYLPVDPDPDRPTVAAQRADDGSLLHLVRRLIALRRATPALGAGRRGRGAARRLPVRLPARRDPPGGRQPRGRPATAELPELGPARSLIGAGVTLESGSVRADSLSATAVFELG